VQATSLVQVALSMARLLGKPCLHDSGILNCKIGKQRKYSIRSTHECIKAHEFMEYLGPEGGIWTLEISAHLPEEQRLHGVCGGAAFGPEGGRPLLPSVYP